jgi:hypothetical protein
MGSPGDRLLRKRRNISHDVGVHTLISLLGDPPYVFSRDEPGVSVYEWDCGCAACIIEQVQICTVQWCDVHGAQVRHLHLV